MRGNTPCFANTIDVNDQEDLPNIGKRIHRRIVHSDIMEVFRITPMIAKEASNKFQSSSQILSQKS